MSETVYSSLLVAASSDPQFKLKSADETDQEFLHRLADVISSVAEPVWQGLSAEARKWYDDSIDDAAADGLKQELTKPDGYDIKVPEAKVEAAGTRRRRAEPTPQLSIYEILVNQAKTNTPDFAEKHTRESDQAFLARLLQNLGDVCPEVASSWVNAADLSLESGRPIALPPGYPEAKAKASEPSKPVEAVQPAEDAPATGERKLSNIEKYQQRLAAGEVQATPRKKREAAEKPAKVAKAPKEPKVKTTRVVRADSTTALIRDAVTDNQAITVDQLKAILAENGKETSLQTITTTRASHIAAIRSLQRKGRWLEAA